MGVSATGKSTVAAALADELGRTFVEGDDLHPPANVAKMESGTPLDDADRWPWLRRINERLREHADRGEPVVVTCSALKRVYRDALRDGVDDLSFVHLDAPYDVLLPRMQQRDKHFMPTELLRSQVADLEPLDADEDGVVVDVSPALEAVQISALRAVRERLLRR